MLKLKRTYDPADSQDGYRVLVDRLWPRGISKEKTKVDLWMKEIAPSDALRKWFGHDPERWTEFQARYRKELQKKSELVKEIRQLDRKLPCGNTLLYSAKDELHNQAVALLAFLKKRN